MFTLAHKPQNFLKVISDSIQLYKACLRTVWRWQLFWLIPMVFLPSGGLNSGGVTSILSAHLNAPSANGLLIFYSLLALIFTIFGETFLLYKIYNMGIEGDSSNQKSFLIAKNKFLPILGGYVINWLILLAVIIIAGLLFGLIFFLLSLVSGGYTGALYTIIFIMLIVGAFLITLMFFFNLFILFENNKIIQSIKASIKLVWGHWWRTFGILLVPIIIIFLITQIFNLLMSLVMPRIGIAANISNLCVLTLLYPWFNSVILVQFNDLRFRQKTALESPPSTKINNNLTG